MKFDSVKNLLIRHRYAIITAVIVACIAGLPQVIVRSALGSADRGVPYLANDSEPEYLSRVHDILDGHWSASSSVLYEYKDSTTLMPPTGEFIFYALPVKLTGLPLSTVIFLSKFLYPALLFFFAYLFILSLLNKNDEGARLSAIAGALLIVLAYDAYDYRNFIPYILHGTQDSAGLLWNRLVNPITGALLLFAFLWLLSRVVRGKSGWWTIGIPGLVLAAMSGYIFSFALGLTISALIGLYFIWQKNWRMMWRVYAPVCIALLLNVFYFVTVLLAMRGALALSDPRKSGMFFTHVPMINLVSLVSLLGVVICFVLYFDRDTIEERDRRWWFFALAAVISCELVYNQQIITGRTVWPQHFVQYTTPLSMAMVAVFLHNIVRQYAKNIWCIGVVLFFIITVPFAWRGFEAATQNTVQKYANWQSFSGVLEYLNSHAPKDCVVYVSSNYDNEMNRFIPALTSCNVYHSFYVFNGVPEDRILHNFLIDVRLRGISQRDLKKYFEDHATYMHAYFFRGWYDFPGFRDSWTQKTGNAQESEAWFTSLENIIQQKYAEYARKSIYAKLVQYRLDYFVVDTSQQPQVNPARYSFLVPVGQFDRFAVYSVIQPKK